MVYVGMDIHKHYSSVAVIDQEGETVERSRAEHRFREELLGYFNKFPKETQVVMEASCGWGWLSEVLEDMGLKVKLAHPSKGESNSGESDKDGQGGCYSISSAFTDELFTAGLFIS
jgi:transposase